jgi:hypothetical protein
MQQTRDARYLFTVALRADFMGDDSWTELTRYDLKNRTSLAITTHGNRVSDFALDPAETLLLTGGLNGICIGPITGEEPHMLFGPAGEYDCDVALSPDGNWIATGDFRSPIVRLERMPQGQPFQTLPRAEFLERVRSLTCFRVVNDPKAATGYAVVRAPFTGWEKVPTW